MHFSMKGYGVAWFLVHSWCVTLEMCSIQKFDRHYILLGQWLNFKLFRIAYLVGKIKFKLFFSGSIGWVRYNISFYFLVTIYTPQSSICLLKFNICRRRWRPHNSETQPTLWLMLQPQPHPPEARAFWGSFMFFKRGGGWLTTILPFRPCSISTHTPLSPAQEAREMLIHKRKTLSEAKATPMTQVGMTMGEDGGRLMFLGKLEQHKAASIRWQVFPDWRLARRWWKESGAARCWTKGFPKL